MEPEPAGPVVDDHRLPDSLAQALPDDAGDDVGRTARRKWHDPSNRLRRKNPRAGRGALPMNCPGREGKRHREHDQVQPVFGAFH